MAYVLRFRRRWVLAVTSMLAIISLLSLGGCAYFKEWQQLPTQRSDEETIYVVSHGWHTGIVVARNKLGDKLAFVPGELGESPYYEFGWGEKDFYQAPENTVGLALQALLWVNDSTMHVVAVPSLPSEYFSDSEVVELRLSSDGHQNLTTAIAASFAKDASGLSKSSRDGLYGQSRFFDGVGKYYLLHTCNTWTAKTLAKAGAPLTGVLTLTASGVIRQSQWAAKKYQCCAQ
jgi:uncharacterized protein (TIGR02117 family)